MFWKPGNIGVGSFQPTGGKIRSIKTRSFPEDVVKAITEPLIAKFHAYAVGKLSKPVFGQGPKYTTLYLQNDPFQNMAILCYFEVSMLNFRDVGLA